MEITTKKLETHFTGIGEVKGFEFKQVFENDFGYIYEVSSDNIFSHYEVFEKKTTPICIDFAKKIFSETEFKETYPKANNFGISAYSVPQIKDAFLKLDIITANKKESK